MNQQSIQLTAAVQAAMESHAARERPFECCGLLSGTDKTIVAAHPLRNTAERRESRYFASPEDLFATMRRIREAGQQMLGIYHSHPRTAAYPSAADIEAAFYPEAIYFIIALEPEIELRAFTIRETRIQEVKVHLIEL